MKSMHCFLSNLFFVSRVKLTEKGMNQFLMENSISLVLSDSYKRIYSTNGREFCQLSQFPKNINCVSFYFDPIFEHVDKRFKLNKPVLLCNESNNYTAIVLSILMRKNHWDLEDTIRNLQKMGIILKIKKEEISRLKRYEFEKDLRIDRNNITEIIPNLFLGNFFAAEDGPTIRDNGINIIINMTNEEYEISFEDENVIYFNFPLYDTETEDILKYFLKTFNVIEKSLKENKKVLVHCAAGYSRSPTIVIAFLMKKRKMKYNEAYEFVREKRRIKPNSGFVKQLKKYEKILKI